MSRRPARHAGRRTPRAAGRPVPTARPQSLDADAAKVESEAFGESSNLDGYYKLVVRARCRFGRTRPPTLPTSAPQALKTYKLRKKLQAAVESAPARQSTVDLS